MRNSIRLSSIYLRRCWNGAVAQLTRCKLTATTSELSEVACGTHYTYRCIVLRVMPSAKHWHLLGPNSQLSSISLSIHVDPQLFVFFVGVCRLLGGVVVMGVGLVIEWSRVRLPAGALPGSLGQLSLLSFYPLYAAARICHGNSIRLSVCSSVKKT